MSRPGVPAPMSTDSKDKQVPLRLHHPPTGGGTPPPGQPPAGGELPAAETVSPDDLAGAQRTAAGESSEVDELRSRLAEMEAEAKKYFDLYLRERAELENFKKRTRRELAESIQLANESLIRDLLPVLDNLQRAVQHAEGGGDGAPLVEGVALVLKAFEEILRHYGVTAIDAAPGTPFDPTIHEAVAREAGEGQPNSILRQHERGFLLHGRLLRPAKVVVVTGEPREGGAGGAVEKNGHRG